MKSQVSNHRVQKDIDCQNRRGFGGGSGPKQETFPSTETISKHHHVKTSKESRWTKRPKVDVFIYRHTPHYNMSAFRLFEQAGDEEFSILARRRQKNMMNRGIRGRIRD